MSLPPQPSSDDAPQSAPASPFGPPLPAQDGVGGVIADRGTRAPQPPSRARVALRLVGSFLIGAVVGTVGTVMFQASHPFGITLALAATLAGAVTARAWNAWSSLTLYALGWMVATGILAFVTGPGGDVIVPAGTLSNVWLIGGVVAIVVASFLPWWWFAVEPRRPRRVEAGASPVELPPNA